MVWNYCYKYIKTNGRAETANIYPFYFENIINTKILGVFQENIENISKTVNIKILIPKELFIDQKKYPINYIQTESMEQRVPIIHKTKKYNIHGKWEKLNSTQPPDKEPNEESNKEASVSNYTIDQSRVWKHFKTILLFYTFFCLLHILPLNPYASIPYYYWH